MKYFLTAVILAVTLFAGQQVKACEIEFSVLGEEKESYTTGDELIVKINVIYTHRICPEGINNTKFKYDGFKVLGATKWKEVGNGKYERKLKLKVIAGSTKNMVLEAIRKCDKEGGYGKISFKRANPV